MTLDSIVISGTGLYTPPDAVSNDALVAAYNTWAETENAANAAAITAGEKDAIPLSDTDFIEKASGIKNRYMMNGDGAIDPKLLKTQMSSLTDKDDLFGDIAQVHMSVEAADQAMAKAGVTGADIDLVIFSSSLWERVVPSTAVVIQDKLGIKGHAYDMAVGCSSATFGMSNAFDAISTGLAKRVLVVTAEYVTPAMNYKDRDSHFIFGDAAVAMIVEKEETANPRHAFRIKQRKLHTELSYNIRAGFGSRVLIDDPALLESANLRFLQNGRTVFKELVPAVVELVQGELAKASMDVDAVRRMWLHQANINMNGFATKKLIGEDPSDDRAPIILDEYANTAGAGCMIAFNKHSDDLKSGDMGVICSFGAGYSIGFILVEKV